MPDSATPELSALELARALESDRPLQVIDVRAPGRVAAGHIDSVPAGRFHNIVGSRLATLASLEGTGIDAALPTAVVCGQGNDSKKLAIHLRELGCDARSLQGGMASWMMLTLARELDTPPSLDRLIQFDRVGKGALGYLLVSDGQALIVDPPRDFSAYLESARETGAEVVGVADTHVHADYISGAPRLARTLHVPYYLHPADGIYPYDDTPGRLDFVPLEADQTLDFGRCSVRVMHTPGHTEGSLTYLVDEAAALTGDLVLIGSIGRPDLAGKLGEWTAQLWSSLEAARREWPRELSVYPAHYAGDCERRADRSVGALFGRLLQTNEALGITKRDEFFDWVASRTGGFPDAYRQIKAVNVALVTVDDKQAEELEVGRNECALGGG